MRTESKSPSSKQLRDLQNSHKVLNTSPSSRLLKNLTTKPISKLTPNPVSLTNLSFRTSPSPRANQTTTTPRQRTRPDLSNNTSKVNKSQINRKLDDSRILTEGDLSIVREPKTARGDIYRVASPRSVERNSARTPVLADKKREERTNIQVS